MIRLCKIGIHLVLITESNTTPYTVYYISSEKIGVRYQLMYHNNAIIPFTNVSDFEDCDGVTFTEQTLDKFLSELKDTQGDINTQNLDFIYTKDDLPIPVSGVITLLANKTYFFLANVDLTGDRLFCNENVTILGASSENCSITSSGLGLGVALISSMYTVPIRHISINDVDTALDFDGLAVTMALDWTGVNFNNVPNIGVVKNASNFIFSKGAFINSKGLIFDENQGTVSFDNCLISGDGSAGNIIEIPSTAVISRRFRIVYSAVVSFGSTTAINVSTSATIANEGYILDTVNFSGGSTYIAGVQYNNNKALFRFCRGVSNSTEISQYFANGNTTATTITTISAPVKAAVTTTSSSITEKFVNTDNRSTYVGALTRTFKVQATASLTCGNNRQISAYIFKNGVQILNSEAAVTTNGNGRAENVTAQTILELSENDYIEIWIENNSDTQNVTVSDINVIIQ